MRGLHDGLRCGGCDDGASGLSTSRLACLFGRRENGDGLVFSNFDQAVREAEGAFVEEGRVVVHLDIEGAVVIMAVGGPTAATVGRRLQDDEIAPDFDRFPNVGEGALSDGVFLDHEREGGGGVAALVDAEPGVIDRRRLGLRRVRLFHGLWLFDWRRRGLECVFQGNAQRGLWLIVQDAGDRWRCRCDLRAFRLCGFLDESASLAAQALRVGYLVVAKANIAADFPAIHVKRSLA